jgi:alpha-D-ribose 1-methylphosphonate 5-triphosphate synthase subunit PhnH
MTIDLPGFADPVAGAQCCFRAVLDAMSRPGSRQEAGQGLQAPAPLQPAAAALLLTLVDADTKVWLPPDYAPARDWIAFHCGAAFASAPGEADFVLASELPDIMGLNAGSDAGPEESATVILQVLGFGGGRDVVLSGPGLARPARLNVAGLPADFVGRWAANHALFPRGVDVILCAGREIAALPRSVAISEG